MTLSLLQFIQRLINQKQAGGTKTVPKAVKGLQKLFFVH